MAIPFVRARGQTPDAVRLTHLGTRREALHPHLELYDLVQDPWEQVNLVDKPEHAAIRNELARRLYQTWSRPTTHSCAAPSPRRNTRRR